MSCKKSFQLALKSLFGKLLLYAEPTLPDRMLDDFDHVKGEIHDSHCH